jgi:hypothetical protein
MPKSAITTPKSATKTPKSAPKSATKFKRVMSRT